MNDFQQLSQWITGLFVHSIWIGGLLFMMLKTIQLILPDRSMGIKHTLFNLLLPLFLVIMVVLGISQFPSLGGNVPKISLISAMVFYSMEEIRSQGSSFDLQNIVLIAYGVGILIFSTRLFMSALNSHRIILRSSPAKRELMVLVESLKRKLRVPLNVRLRVNNRLGEAGVFGLFRPIIIVPLSILSTLPLDEVESIFLHELIHLKRMDPLFNIVQRITEVIFFFNPFIWIISKSVSREREYLCDLQVLNYTEAPIPYAKALLNVALLQSGNGLLALRATGRSRKELLTRIERISNTHHMKTNKRRRADLFLVLLAGTLITVTLTSFSTALFTIDKGTQNSTSLQTSSLVPKVESNTSFNREQANSAMDSKMLISPSMDSDYKQVFTAPDTLTKKERKRMIEEMEKQLEELKSIDWDKKAKEIQIAQEKAMKELSENMKQIEVKIQKQLSEIDHEKMHQHLMQAQIALDDLDVEINMDSIRANIEYVFDIDMDMDSLLQEVKVEIKEINLEDIKEDMEAAIKELEEQIESLKEGNGGKK